MSKGLAHLQPCVGVEILFKKRFLSDFQVAEVYTGSKWNLDILP